MWDECYNKKENTDEVKNMVLIESNFDAPTYRAFYRYDAFFKSSKALVLAIGEILLAALLIYCITVGYSQLVLVAVIFIVALPVVYVVQVESTMRKYIALAKLKTDPIPVRFEISDKKIITLNKRTAQHKTYKWSEIAAARETGKFLFLYVNKTQAVVLNKEHVKEGKLEDLQRWSKTLVQKHSGKKPR